MPICSECGHTNLDNASICADCGAVLIDDNPQKTLPVDETVFFQAASIRESITNALESPEAVEAKTAENDVILYFPNDELLISIEDIVILGRESGRGKTVIDLTEFEGYRKGVSRKHAQIQRFANGELEIMDLGSSNGTFLNENQIDPNQYYPLSNGDWIRLGSLTMRVRF